jgi:hypothetical protein
MAEDEKMKQVYQNVQELLGASLIAFYEDDGNKLATQTGSGFAVLVDGRPFILTAKHCLYGHHDEKTPSEFYFHNGEGLEKVPDEAVVSLPDDDIAGFFTDSIDVGRCLPESAIVGGPSAGTAMLLIYGFLHRDFHRHQVILMPGPWAIAETEVPSPPGYITMRYERSNVVNAATGQRTTGPIPSGLSGGPMLDVAALYRGYVSVRGVFVKTGVNAGTAIGEHADKILQLLELARQNG